MYENWRRMRDGAPADGAFEFPIVSDAQIVSDLRSGFGPYQLLNPVSATSDAPFTSAVIVRVDYHLAHDLAVATAPVEKTDSSAFHGGWIKDELAALVSLSLGIRARAGGTTREFSTDGDPRGTPVEWDRLEDPIPLRGQRLIVPRLRGEHSLDDLQQLGLLPDADPDLVVALIRAARLYQDAVWLADVEPNMAWLLLVSAVEAAAAHWRATEDDPVDRLRTSRPDLEPLLLEAGGQELLSNVAIQIAPYMGATRRFIDFLETFLPDPPTDRPPAWAQFDWKDKRAMGKAFGLVYRYRSIALHSGVPFPSPMCAPPTRISAASSVAEIPTGLSTRWRGAAWKHTDTPLLLSTFEHIARGSLLKWWHRTVSRGAHADAPQVVAIPASVSPQLTD